MASTPSKQAITKGSETVVRFPKSDRFDSVPVSPWGRTTLAGTRGGVGGPNRGENKSTGPGVVYLFLIHGERGGCRRRPAAGAASRRPESPIRKPSRRGVVKE